MRIICPIQVNKANEKMGLKGSIPGNPKHCAKSLHMNGANRQGPFPLTKRGVLAQTKSSPNFFYMHPFCSSKFRLSISSLSGPWKQKRIEGPPHSPLYKAKHVHLPCSLFCVKHIPTMPFSSFPLSSLSYIMKRKKQDKGQNNTCPKRQTDARVKRGRSHSGLFSSCKTLAMRAQ